MNFIAILSKRSRHKPVLYTEWLHLYEILEMKTNIQWSDKNHISGCLGLGAEWGMTRKCVQEPFGDDENVLYFYCVGVRNCQNALNSTQWVQFIVCKLYQ